MTLHAVMKQREDLTKRLVAALAHLPPERQIHIVASYFSLDELEMLVKSQEEHR